MILSRSSLFAAALTLSIATWGCATKKHLREALAPVQQQINQVQKDSAENRRAIGDLDRAVSSADEKAQDAGRKAQDALNAAAQAKSVADQAAAKAGAANSQAQQAMSRASQVDANLKNALQNLDSYKLSKSAQVYFKVGRSELSNEAREQLDQAVANAANTHNYIVEVEGYTDRTGSTEANQELARQRADAVVHYLAVEKNIPLRDVRSLGVGSEFPNADNKTRDARKENRRVDVKIYARNIGPPRVAGETATAGEPLSDGSAYPPPPIHTGSKEKPPRVDIREVGRAFLVAGEKEPDGYGLYSYILFPAKPANDEQKKRYTQFLDAYLSLNDMVKVEGALKTEGQLDTKKLHRSIVPVSSVPHDLTSGNILDVYDHARASLLLDNASVHDSAILRVRGGPYLVCALRPLSAEKPDDRLVQTLDWVPPGDLVNAWFQFFLAKAATPRDWSRKTFYEMALTAQTWLENTASTVPEVQKSVMTSLVWFTGSSGKTPGK